MSTELRQFVKVYEKETRRRMDGWMGRMDRKDRQVQNQLHISL